jgi:hypothetical protein
MKLGQLAAADVVAKAQAVLSEPALLRAMFDVGYFPPNTPPCKHRDGQRQKAARLSAAFYGA